MRKRIFDLMLLIIGLPLLLPIFIVIYFTNYIKIGRPVFFCQERGGFKGQKFNIWKFRSMTNECDSDNQLLPDEDRLTAFGRWLRATSLDELPCLWNLLKGDISLVGPRPFMSQYLPLYSNEQMGRHDVRPGITGWAQVKGRNAISWEEKFALDLWYVENHTFWLDCKILLMTFAAVFKRKDISAYDDVTMPVFKGSQNTK